MKVDECLHVMRVLYVVLQREKFLSPGKFLEIGRARRSKVQREAQRLWRNLPIPTCKRICDCIRDRTCVHTFDTPSNPATPQLGGLINLNSGDNYSVWQL
jgi:hypothetical protein